MLGQGGTVEPGSAEPGIRDLRTLDVSSKGKMALWVAPNASRAAPGGPGRPPGAPARPESPSDR